MMGVMIEKDRGGRIEKVCGVVRNGSVGLERGGAVARIGKGNRMTISDG